MSESRARQTAQQRLAPAWTRDHVLGCLLLAVKQIESEGQPRIAAQMRHLAMLWYTGARRASPGRNRGGGSADGRSRRRTKGQDTVQAQG